MPDHSLHRYFLVVDDEVINHMLQLTKPGEYDLTTAEACSIKLYDAWSNIGFEVYGYVPDPEEDEGMVTDEDMEAYEGWFWMVAKRLVSF